MRHQQDLNTHLQSTGWTLFHGITWELVVDTKTFSFVFFTGYFISSLLRSLIKRNRSYMIRYCSVFFLRGKNLKQKTSPFSIHLISLPSRRNYRDTVIKSLFFPYGVSHFSRSVGIFEGIVSLAGRFPVTHRVLHYWGWFIEKSGLVITIYMYF